MVERVRCCNVAYAHNFAGLPLSAGVMSQGMGWVALSVLGFHSGSSRRGEWSSPSERSTLSDRRLMVVVPRTFAFAPLRGRQLSAGADFAAMVVRKALVALRPQRWHVRASISLRTPVRVHVDHWCWQSGRLPAGIMGVPTKPRFRAIDEKRYAID